MYIRTIDGPPLRFVKPRRSNMCTHPPVDSSSRPVETDCCAMIAALREPSIYPHPVRRVDVRETHISWVILAGQYVYKVKKPVDLGFCNFSTLAQRKFFCEEELRLNRRLTPELYLDVVPITGRPAAPMLGGTGTAIDYAVKMVRFPDHLRGDEVLRRGGLRRRHIDGLARDVADFHGSLRPASPEECCATPAMLRERLTDNFDRVAACRRQPAEPVRIVALRGRAEAEIEARQVEFLRRSRDGSVRECHGDLHLANMVLLEGRLRMFDCLEFNPQLRWIDVMSEIAFVAMDLDYHQRRDLSWRFLSRYLEHTGDYGGLPVLNHYLAYRAMVRAKVACIRAQQDACEAEECEAQGHVALVEQYLGPADPGLILMHGVSGTGKSHLAELLVEGAGAVRLRSDVTRRRLCGNDDPEIRYAPEVTHRVYKQLLGDAERVTGSGRSAVVDAAFLTRRHRERFQRLAIEHGIPFVIVSVDAPDAVLQRRIEARLRSGLDPSEATMDVVRAQRRALEVLTASEQACSVPVDSGAPVDARALVARVRAVGRA